MTNHRNLLLLAFAVFVAIFSVLTVLFWTFMSDTFLVPIYYFLWVCGLLVNSVPQGGYLALLVFLSIVIGAKTLEGMHTGPHRRRVIRHQPNSSTRYLHWRMLCMHAQGNWFAKGRLGFEARKLILSILAYEQGVDLLEAEAMVRNGTLMVPDMLRSIIETKTIPDALPSRFSGVLSRLRRPVLRGDSRPDPYLVQFLAEFTSFVEHHLEITAHVGNKSES